MNQKITLSEQIKAVAREIAMRRNVYAGRVRSGSMKESDASYQIACMEAVLETLQEISAGHEDPA